MNYHTGESPKRAKNMKNLQLDLSSNDIKRKVRSNTTGMEGRMSSSTPITTGFIQIPNSSQQPPPPPSLLRTMSAGQARPLQRRRTTTLSLSIPSDFVPPQANDSSSSPASSPLVPFTPAETVTPQMWKPQPSSSSSSSSLKAASLSDNSSSDTLSEIPEESRKVNAYPHGPICVLEPNLYLYSEPSLEQISSFDVIINVAKELTNHASEIEKHKGGEYHFIPWTHSSKLSPDFPRLTSLIDDSLRENKRVLIHCQCGVSRSVSLIVAYFMKKFCLGYNSAYSLLKARAPAICPNLSLIYELMEWGKTLGYNVVPPSPDKPIDLNADRENTQQQQLSLPISSSKSSLLSPTETSLVTGGLSGIQLESSSSECITSP